MSPNRRTIASLRTLCAWYRAAAIPAIVGGGSGAALAFAFSSNVALAPAFALSVVASGLLVASSLQASDFQLRAVGSRQRATLVGMDAGGRRAAYPGGGAGPAEDAQIAVTAVRAIEPDYLPADWLQGARAVRESRLERALHRGLDIVASLLLILLTLPLLLLVAVAIRIDSRGPILYRQERVGRDGRVFTILKFRSMSVDAEAGGTEVWASVGDPRVTRIGQILRITRIDEIPQVVNILRGDMAFVGPRPERPTFVAQLSEAIPHYQDRSIVRPGLTGWAQIRYRYGASVEDARTKLSYDLYYIRERSIILDLRIIVSTVRVVLCGLGAR